MYKPYVSVEKSNKKSKENSKLEKKNKKDTALMDEFNRINVEPLNFVRKTLLAHDECLSYL
jgi:hypothetical protein